MLFDIPTIQTKCYFKDHGKFQVRSSEANDPKILAPKLRQGDLEEIRYSSGNTAQVALKQSFENSKVCFSLLDTGGEIFAMVGVSWTHSPKVGVIWFLSSNHLYKVSRSFVDVAPIYIDFLLKGHDLIFNNIYKGNHAAIRWIRYLGFEATTEYPEFGKHKKPFTEYCKFANPKLRDLYISRDWFQYLELHDDRIIS